MPHRSGGMVDPSVDVGAPGFERGRAGTGDADGERVRWVHRVGWFLMSEPVPSHFGQDLSQSRGERMVAQPGISKLGGACFRIAGRSLFQPGQRRDPSLTAAKEY
jgi:hypothetical protein